MPTPPPKKRLPRPLPQRRIESQEASDIQPPPAPPCCVERVASQCSHTHTHTHTHTHMKTHAHENTHEKHIHIQTKKKNKKKKNKKTMIKKKKNMSHACFQKTNPKCWRRAFISTAAIHTGTAASRAAVSACWRALPMHAWLDRGVKRVAVAAACENGCWWNIKMSEQLTRRVKNKHFLFFFFAEKQPYRLQQPEVGQLTCCPILAGVR